MITKELFETYVPSAVMPTDALFERIADYIAQGEAYAQRFMRPAWDNYEGNATLATPARRVICLEAYNLALPHLDIVLTETGIGVVNNQNVAPASAERVNRLRQQVRDSRDDAVDDLIDALRGVQAWRNHIVSGELFSLLVWNAHLQMPIMGIADGHRTKLDELRPKITAAEELLQQRVSWQLLNELCNAQLENSTTAKQNTVIHKSLLLIGSMLRGDVDEARFQMAKLVEFLEQHLSDFDSYANSSAHQANTFTPFANQKDDKTYFFG